MSKESELAKKVTDAVKAIDKLAGDIVRDWKKVKEAIEELKKLKGERGGEE